LNFSNTVVSSIRVFRRKRRNGGNGELNRILRGDGVPREVRGSSARRGNHENASTQEPDAAWRVWWNFEKISQITTSSLKKHVSC
jgi:hypothetical protein